MSPSVKLRTYSFVHDIPTGLFRVGHSKHFRQSRATEANYLSAKLPAPTNEVMAATGKTALPSRLLDICYILIGSAVGAAFCFSLLPHFGVRSYPLELFSNFRLQYAGGAALSALLFVSAKRWRLAGCSLLVIGVNVVAFLPNYLPQPIAGSDADNALTVVLANVYASNTRQNEALEVLGKLNGDVLVLQEITTQWVQSLSPILSEYPYQLQQPDDGCFGIGVYSKFPLSAQRIEILGVGQMPVAIVQLEVRGEVVSLLAGHPVPPISKEFFTIRNLQLYSMASEVAKFEGHTMWLGDFNVSPWSPIFAENLALAGVRDARVGFGIIPTWPVDSPLLFTAIDHVLVGPSIFVTSLEGFHFPGSDHRGLVARIRF